jgi:hypothetical protein
MFRNVLCAMAVMTVCIGIASADDFMAMIKKVEDGNVTFVNLAPDSKKNERTLPAAKDVKVFTGKFNPATKKLEEDTPLEGGLTNDAFKNFKFLMSNVTTSTDGKNITKIVIMQKK